MFTNLNSTRIPNHLMLILTRAQCTWVPIAGNPNPNPILTQSFLISTTLSHTPISNQFSLSLTTAFLTWVATGGNPNHNATLSRTDYHESYLYPIPMHII